MESSVLANLTIGCGSIFHPGDPPQADQALSETRALEVTRLFPAGRGVVPDGRDRSHGKGFPRTIAA